MKKIYLASPLGFSPENEPYRMKIKARLQELGYEILDPWDQDFVQEIEAAYALDCCSGREGFFRDIASKIGRCNEELIREADSLLAVLDGAEVDSGTASEVGFASALGKRCFGLRTDLRDTGDFPGVPVNLQVLHFIDRSGGRLFRKIEDIEI